MKKFLILLTAMLLTITLAGCNGPDNKDENVIYTTVYPVQFIVETLVGDTVEVERVPGSTTGGHSDELYWTGKDIIDMLNSDIIFYVDAGVDNYIENASDSVFDDGDVKLFNISEFVTYAQVCYSHDHDHEEHDEDGHEEEPVVCDENMLSDDPHFWLSPIKMLYVATVIKNELISQYPDNIELIENNFVTLSASLEKLDDDFQAMANQAVKPIITTSMIFNYIHEAYEIEIISLSTDAHNSEVVPGDVIEFVNEAVFHEIHYILYEANTNSPSGDLVLEQLLLQDSTAEAKSLYSLGNITQEQIDNGSTYLTLMYENLDILKDATK